MLVYCKNCVLPNTRPNNFLNKNGICIACENHKISNLKINWKKRKKEFSLLVKNIKKLNRKYDCLIPVSGGKDSTWQVIECLKMGMNPLCFSYKPPLMTEIGLINLQNLIDLGVHHIHFTINKKAESKFVLKALKKYGTIGIPMHMAIFNISLNLANNFNIPLIIWGENSGMEYGGNDKEAYGKELNTNWIKKYGVSFGKNAYDWIDNQLTKKDLAPFLPPDKKSFEKKNIRSIFLGYYLRYDPIKSYKVEKKNGFKELKSGPKTGFYNYADIDDNMISIHHWFKWYKFGFIRAQDNLSLEIRNKRITRENALKILENTNLVKPPISDIKKFCKFVNISEKEFFKIAEKHRNKSIWKLKNRKWILENCINKY